MHIRRYDKYRDEDKLMKLIEGQGKEWQCYSSVESSGKYRMALENSITYVACEGDVLCGYSRSIDDCGFYIYVCDLLVMEEYRGRAIGRKLMECICSDYPDQLVYVMSDVDRYYEKLGYDKEGSVFEVSEVENG